MESPMQASSTMPLRPMRSDSFPACGPVTTLAMPPRRNINAISSPVAPRSRSSQVGR